MSQLPSDVLRAHRAYLREELSKFVGKDSPARAIWWQQGARMQKSLLQLSSDVSALRSWSSAVGASNPKLPTAPELLFVGLAEHEAALSSWLMPSQADYHDENGHVIPIPAGRESSRSEQIAAYGLWLVTREFDRLLALRDSHNRTSHAANDALLQHPAECLLFAYQSLYYAQRLATGSGPTPQEREKARLVDFAELGRHGADIHHGPMRELRRWTVRRYHELKPDRKWKSANHAAYDLKVEVIAHGKTIDAKLTESNAQSTIARWIRAENGGKAISLSAPSVAPRRTR